MRGLSMICKRCDVNQVKPERMIQGYCRHCFTAVKQNQKRLNKLADKVYNG